jgi:hypothetical protein
MIVPEVAGAAAPELDALRSACDAVVARLGRSGARSLLMVGSGDRSGGYAHPFHGSFRPFGLPVDVGTSSGRALPLSLSVGWWLVERSFRPAGDCAFEALAVAVDEPVESCVSVGTEIGAPGPWALLVLGDGSARRGVKAPGYDDPRAARFDDRVAQALATADTETLLALDPGLSTELMVAGRTPWQVLAAAVRAAGGPWRADLSYSAAPHGVAYFVSSWEPA